MVIGALLQEVEIVDISSAVAEVIEVVGETTTTGSIVTKRDSSSLQPATVLTKKKLQP